jgi:hypothetical protein
MKFKKKRSFSMQPRSTSIQDPFIDSMLNDSVNPWPMRRKFLLVATVLFLVTVSWINLLSSLNFNWDKIPFIKRIMVSYDQNFDGRHDDWRQCSAIVRMMFFISMVTNVSVKKPSVLLKDMGMLFSGIYMFTVSQEFACVAGRTVNSSFLGIADLIVSMSYALVLVYYCSYPRHTLWKPVPLVISLYVLWGLILFTPAIIVDISK